MPRSGGFFDRKPVPATGTQERNPMGSESLLGVGAFIFFLLGW